MDVDIEKEPVQPCRPQVRSERHDGWTEERRAIFLETLAATGNVTAAVEAVGMKESSVRALRKRDAGFGAAWDEAVMIAYERLELVMLERAINGTDRPIVRSDREVAVMKQYSDAVGIRLLQAHRKTAMRARERAEHACDPEEAFEVLKCRLAAMRERSVADGPSGDRNG